MLNLKKNIMKKIIALIVTILSLQVSFAQEKSILKEIQDNIDLIEKEKQTLENKKKPLIEKDKKIGESLKKNMFLKDKQSKAKQQELIKQSLAISNQIRPIDDQIKLLNEKQEKYKRKDIFRVKERVYETFTNLMKKDEFETQEEYSKKLAHKNEIIEAVLIENLYREEKATRMKLIEYNVDNQMYSVELQKDDYKNDITISGNLKIDRDNAKKLKESARGIETLPISTGDVNSLFMVEGDIFPSNYDNKYDILVSYKSLGDTDFSTDELGLSEYFPENYIINPRKIQQEAYNKFMEEYNEIQSSIEKAKNKASELYKEYRDLANKYRHTGDSDIWKMAQAKYKESEDIRNYEIKQLEHISYEKNLNQTFESLKEGNYSALNFLEKAKQLIEKKE